MDTMTREEFERIVSEDPALSAPMRKAAAAVSPRTRGTFGTPTELAAIAVLFPVTVFVVREIGLPWLCELKLYSELWRQKFHAWVDGEYGKHGLDPDAAEAAGSALRRELEAITEANARRSWERLVALLQQEIPDTEEDS